MAIGVMGVVRKLPPEFPLTLAENAGNMIHGNAPFEMFPEAVHSSDRAAILATGSKSFVSFVNQHCSHLIVTMANTLRLNADDGARFARLQATLERIEKPIVVFGLGVQSDSDDISEASLPAEATSLMRFLADRSPFIGVRGQMTADVLSEVCGVDNTMVLGCPSLYSRPDALKILRQNWQNSAGRPAFNGTKLHQPPERRALQRAVSHGHFIVEPVNRFNHAYYVDVSKGNQEAEVPYFLKSYAPQNVDTRPSDEIAARFRQNYRLFRDTKSWYTFNAESVAFTYGTRFHVNMASILSGKPALWVTHDARTRELTRALHLPAITQEKFDLLEPAEISAQYDYTEFFDNIDSLVLKFNDYLDAVGLPRVKSPNRS